MLKYWQILWSLSKFHLFPSLGMATHIIWLHFGKFPLFPLKFWLIWQLKQWHFSKFHHFIIKSLVDHASYKYCVICMVKHKSSHFFPHIYWLIGSKCNGISRNFVIFILVPYFVHNIVFYVWSNTRVILSHHWFGSLAVNAGEINEILIISHQFSTVWLILSNQCLKIIIPIYGLPFGRYPIGSIGVQGTILHKNCHVNIFY